MANSNPPAGNGSAKKAEARPLYGMTCEVEHLHYEGGPDPWVSVREQANRADRSKFAILARSKKSRDPATATSDVDSIVIQSPLLRDILQTTLKGYRGVDTTREPLIFSWPFPPLVHRRQEMRDALQDDSRYSDEARDHLFLLFKLLDGTIGDLIKALDAVTKDDIIAYEHVWAIFPPGCVVLTTRYGEHMASRVRQSRYVDHPRHGPCFELLCDRLDYDGSRFGYASCRLYVLPYADREPVDALDVYPLSHHAKAQELQARLVARGSKFEHLAVGWHHRSYRGPALADSEFGATNTTVDGHIVIDTLGASRWHRHTRAALRSLTAVEPLRRVQASDEHDDFGGDDDYGDDSVSSDQADDIFSFAGPESSRGPRAVPLTDDQRLLCPPFLRGFALDPPGGRWLAFCVDRVALKNPSIRDIPRLELPATRMDLLKTLIRSRTRGKHSSSASTSASAGANAGKDQGTVIHMCGKPGTGKMLTARFVAGSLSVPLLVLDAEGLGSTPADIERRLAQAGAMAARWNAVLLIQRCDVFFAEADPNVWDLDRRHAVAVFRRALERNRGILFLSSSGRAGRAGSSTSTSSTSTSTTSAGNGPDWPCIHVYMPYRSGLDKKAMLPVLRGLLGDYLVDDADGFIDEMNGLGIDYAEVVPKLEACRRLGGGTVSRDLLVKMLDVEGRFDHLR